MKDKLPNRVNHFAAKTIDTVSRNQLENIATTLLVLIFSSVMAYAGARSHGVLFVMSVIVVIASFLVLVAELYVAIKSAFQKDE